MNSEFIQWLVSQTGITGLAAFALWMLNRSWAERLAEMRRHGDEEKAQRGELMEAINRNTEVIGRVLERLSK